MRNVALGTGQPGIHPFQKFLVILAGLRYGIRYDFSVAYKFFVCLILVIVALIYHYWVDFFIILLVNGYMLTSEIFNSCIEAICDYMEDRHREQIKIIKDMAAAAVGISTFIWLVIMIYEAVRLIRVLSNGVQ